MSQVLVTLALGAALPAVGERASIATLLVVITLASFIQRLFTAYLPPLWGWATPAWMRRREYV